VQASVVVCRDSEGRVLLLRRHPHDRAHPSPNGLWCLPGGKLFLNEDPRTGALRELEEETGLRVEREALLQGPSNENIQAYYFLCNGANPNITVSGEHSAASWFNPADIPPNEELVGTFTCMVLAPFRANLAWPLRNSLRLLPDNPGRFGAVRAQDIHTGVDLYCEINTEVQAMEAGEVLSIEDFTGEKAGSPWWNNTRAVLIRGSSGVICYGEVSHVFVKVGARVAQAERIGRVSTPVLKKFKGRPMVMLHLELYAPGEDPPTTIEWPLNTPQPDRLKDPLPLLVPGLQAVFRLESYDGMEYRTFDFAGFRSRR
jgi:8-oxo-dGTP diphosphatase